MRSLDLRYWFIFAGLLALALLPVFAGFSAVAFELAQAAGLVGTVGCIALCGVPLRPRDLRPPTLLSLNLHVLLGWVTLMAVLLHVGGLVLADHAVIEYLKPTMPYYQFAGLAAAVLMIVLVLTAVSRARRRLFRAHRAFQATHVIAGCLVLGLTTVHVVVSARYAGGLQRRVIVLAVVIGALLMLLRRRRRGENTTLKIRGTRSVFGRFWLPVFVNIGLIVAVLLLIFAQGARGALKESLFKRSQALPLDFPHDKHATINCLECHHNYADGRGLEACVACHRSERADLIVGAEARFHTFCLECHRHPDARFRKHGPVAGCHACHRPPDSDLNR